MTQGMMTGWTFTTALIVACIIFVDLPLVWWMVRSMRRSSEKSNYKRRLLVKDADGLPVWQTVRGRVLVGWVSSRGTVTSGIGDWVVIRAAQGKLVACRFDNRDEPATGVIQICDSWPALEAIVPAAVFEKALLEAGIKKPNEYREVPLELGK
jgi:hypothetical protein